MTSVEYGIDVLADIAATLSITRQVRIRSVIVWSSSASSNTSAPFCHQRVRSTEPVIVLTRWPAEHHPDDIAVDLDGKTLFDALGQLDTRTVHRDQAPYCKARIIRRFDARSNAAQRPAVAITSVPYRRPGRVRATRQRGRTRPPSFAAGKFSAFERWQPGDHVLVDLQRGAHEVAIDVLKLVQHGQRGVRIVQRDASSSSCRRWW